MESLSSLTAHPFLSPGVWLLLILTAMYLARKPFHRLMDSLGRIIYKDMRLAATSVHAAEKQLLLRNREVLVSSALETSEARIEREFERVAGAVEHDLEKYPQLRRQISETLLRIEEDHRQCSEIPQALPDWVKVIEAVASIKPAGERTVLHMLEKIHQTLIEQHKIALDRHRRDVSERHSLLSRMAPLWRSVRKRMGSLESTLSNLAERTRRIDRCMADYEKNRTRSTVAENRLRTSSLVRFCIAGGVLAVAALVAMINYYLIALPMAEMWGESSLGSMRTSDVASIVFVSLEVVLGFFVMDALRITRLFSFIGSLGDARRKAALGILLGILLLMAGFESILAFARDRMAADMLELRHTLSGENSEVISSKIPMIGQMLLGIILPGVLVFAAVPFEAFVFSLRTVLGILAVWTLRMTVVFLRMAGNFGFSAGRLAVTLYDLVIFPALWMEGVVVRRRVAAQAQNAAPLETGPKIGAPLRKTHPSSDKSA